MKFVNVTDKNFEDIFLVSAKYEQWQYVKHQIFDMVNNYAAVINREYLPIPFLVYENDNIIGFVQVNYFDRKNLYEICKLIVQETEQNKGYGKQILSEIIKWLRIRYGNGTIAANYKKSNSIADKLFSRSQFKKNVSEAEITAVMEINNRMTEELESEFEEIPYSTVDEFADKIKKSGKYPEEIIGNKDGINFRKINMNETIESPGMKYRHYAPETSCKLVYCEDELDQIFYLKKYIKEYKGDVVVIGFDEHKDKLFLEDKRFISIGKKDDLDGFARNIFSNLREADKMKPYKILIEGVKKEGLGYAIMNRLIRTCEHDMFIL